MLLTGERARAGAEGVSDGQRVAWVQGRGRRPSAELPPGQYLVEDFPVLSAGPTPSIDLEEWEFTITSETGEQQRWDWNGFRALPSERITVDLPCVTHWSKLGTTWEGVSLDRLLEGVETSASYALAESYGGYGTNLPLEDLLDGKAWVAYRYDGQDLEAEHDQLEPVDRRQRARRPPG
jgi:DMSO/TMAO reductase YedYZ molybdopterin-dependent catalytic subunit